MTDSLDDISRLQQQVERLTGELDLLRQREQALGIREEKFRSLFESMQEGFYLVQILRDAAGKADDLLYLEENIASRRLIGQSVRGRRLAEVNPAFERYWLDIIDAVATTGIAQHFERLSQITGRWHDYHVFAAATKDQVAVLSGDITERKLAEQDLKKREEDLRVALEAGRMGTYRLDLQTGEQQWSDEQYRIFGLPPEEGPPSRERFMSLVHPDDHHRVAFTTEDIRTPGTYLDSEFRVLRPDGEVRWVIAHALAGFDAQGHPVELIGVNQDVTEQRKLAASMHSTEERLRQFSEASSDILWIRRADDLQCEYLSPAFHRIYGISRQDAMRGDNLVSWSNLIVPEDREHALAQIDRVRQGERVAFEYRVRRPEDGTIRWLRNTDFPIRDQTGAVALIGGVGHDLTELKQAQDHQRLLLAELQHRVRNSLGVIRLIARKSAAETGEEYEANFLGRLEAFARVQSVVTRNPAAGISLAMLLAEELGAFRAREGDGLTIEGPDVLLLPRAAERLGLAIHELATNAMKYGALIVQGAGLLVRWTMDNDALRLIWHETGLTELKPPTRQGFGTEVLQRTLSYELGAETHVEYRPTGFHCEIPLPRQGVIKE